MSKKKRSEERYPAVPVSQTRSKFSKTTNKGASDSLYVKPRKEKTNVNRKTMRDGKKRFEGTNPRRRPFKVSKVVDAVPNETTVHKALEQQTRENGRLGN